MRAAVVGRGEGGGQPLEEGGLAREQANERSPDQKLVNDDERAGRARVQ